MRQMLTARLTAVLIALSIAAPALAQSTMVRGKVIDAKQQPIPNVTILVESLDGSGRKLSTKTAPDRVGHVPYYRERTEDRYGQQRHPRRPRQGI